MPAAAPSYRNHVLCEVCVDSVEGALAAVAGGADRLELCGPLSLGGITPSLGLVRTIRQQCSLPIHVMLRPHDRDFCYTPAEQAVMLADLEILRDEPVEGFVTGPLTSDGQIDLKFLKALTQVVSASRLNFHRAFDEVRDPPTALEQLIELGLPRILTSGAASDVEQGLENLQRWIERARGQIVVMPGGGVTPENVLSVLRHTGAQEIHFSGRMSAPRAISVRVTPSPVPWQVTSRERVAAIVREARKLIADL